MKKLQFSNIASGVATMLIYKHIGNDDEMGYGVDGNQFANELLWLNEAYAEEIQTINVRINSVGGSVADGLSICSAILNSKIPVDTYIDGMAYSMAGVIAMCGRKKYMADFGTFMMHNVGGGDNDEVIDLLTNSLAIIFERTTALTIDKCRDLMNKETWMSAEECFSLGIIDTITKTTTNKKEMQNKLLQLHAFYKNSLTTTTKTNMNKLTSFLKLANEASEDAILASVEAIKSTADTNADLVATLQAENKKLQDELAAFKQKELAEETAAKEEVLTNAVKEGKLPEAQKADWLNKPLSSTELKNLFAGIKPAHVNIAEGLENGKADPRADWTWSDWERKDPKGLLELQKNNPTIFANLVNAMPKHLSANYNPETDKRF